MMLTGRYCSIRPGPQQSQPPGRKKERREADSGDLKISYMKELQNIKPDTTRTAIQRQYEKQQVVGSLQPKRGQKCYELNLSTGQITEIQIISTAFEVDQNSPSGGRVVHKARLNPRCMYVCAINQANALKKIFQCPDRIATVIAPPSKTL